MTINKKVHMDPSLEIRKLSPRYVRELVQILEIHELWKRLMAIIPKKLEKNNFVCDLTLENQHKYNSEHFRLIENASEKYRRACTEILLDEWGTSGRIRPALGHLLYLLKKAKLFRAADYVAVDLLHQPKPERPRSGPEALVSIDLPESRKEENANNMEEIERLLDEIDYPSSAMLIIRSNSDEAARNNSTQPVIPEIIISPDVDQYNQNAPVFSLPLVLQNEKTTEMNVPSDLIQFSSIKQSASSTTQIIPVISNLLNNTTESNLVNVDVKDISLPVSVTENEQESSGTSEIVGEDSVAELNIPDISALNISIQLEDFPNLSILDQGSSLSSTENSDLLPDLDVLRNSTTKTIGTSQEDVSVLGLLPHSSILNPSKSLSVNISTHLLPMSNNVSQNSSDNSTKSSPCTSPLPNLSLNTLLPHFNYCELESATNNFHTDPYNSPDKNGRFLGSGAFGSVFLALGLLDRPVAIKKLILEDVEVVNIDDTVTKQFRNEVEVLSRYKHENLLSLLGYSCDGCTYCLMYEYIPGGSLKDRLQLTENRLQWKHRLRIARGTARAVSYLHTGFSTPLIHRDIKSANILLDSGNNPKLCDFGLIKLQPSQHTNTATTVFGTSAYMSPEAFRGDISVKLDTFSFGVVLLELLTSLPPMDEKREGSDLVTYIDDNCEDNHITPMLDKDAGSWEENDTNFGQELFLVALKCLEEKKRRPNMVEVTISLEKLLNKLIY